LKILIIKLGSIGDVIHAMPAVARLRQALPEAGIDWLVERYARAVLNNARNIDRVFEIDTLRWRRSILRPRIWQEIQQTARDLRASRYDVVFDLQGLWKSAIIAHLARAREVVGGDRSTLREPHSSIFYSRRVDRGRHPENVIFEHLRIIESFLEDKAGSLHVSPPEPSMTRQIEFDRLSGDADRGWVEEQLRQHQLTNFVIVHPGANWKSKLWPTEHYAELCKRLLAEFGWPILITVGPSEEGLGEQILNQLAGQSVILLSPTLTQFAALAERARLFVGPDTGPLHIAAACGTPIVGIYASTDPVRNGPFSPSDVVVQQNQCGQFCYRRDCGTRRCIAGIPVARVFEAVLKRLDHVPALQ